MEKSPKFYLSLITLILFLGCTSNEEKVKEATDYGFRFYQGSPYHMNAFAYAIEIDSTNAENWRELSVTYLKRGIPHEWKKYYDQAVKHDPKIWQPWRGYLYLWFYRDYKKAILDFDASDILTPNFIDAPQGQSVDYWRGIAYLGLKDYENSLAYFNKFITIETEEWSQDLVEVTAFLYRGIVLIETGEPEKALKDFDKVLFYNRGHSADAKYYKALILKDSDAKKAKELIEASIQDFNNGYYNQRPYVETMRQLYIQDLEVLKQQIEEILSLRS